VVYADSWQGELDTPDQVEPMPADIAWLNTHPGPEPEWEPSPQDLDDMAEASAWQDRLEAMHHAEAANDEAASRYAL
jgi:hypothetical protein